MCHVRHLGAGQPAVHRGADPVVGALTKLSRFCENPIQ